MLILLIPTSLFALDKYVFRVPLDQSNSKGSRESFFSGKGKQSQNQPFYATRVLLDKDTSYAVINITPTDTGEENSLKTLFNIPGSDLIAIIRLEDGQEPVFIEDNRSKFPTNTDWTVTKSSK